MFGQLDRLFREKPNISIISAEAVIAFSQNKTLDWLMNKEVKDITILCKDARKRTKQLRKAFKERQAVMERETRCLVEEKLQAAQQREENRQKRLEGYVNEVQAWGLLQSIEEVDSAVRTLKTKRDKTSALKAQLLFRKHVLKQNANSDVYQFSKKVNDKKRDNLSIKEMTINVKS